MDLQFKRQSGTPTISIELCPMRSRPRDQGQEVLEAVETAYAGATVGQTFPGTRTVDTVVLLPETCVIGPTARSADDQRAFGPGAPVAGRQR